MTKRIWAAVAALLLPLAGIAGCGDDGPLSCADVTYRQDAVQWVTSVPTELRSRPRGPVIRKLAADSPLQPRRDKPQVSGWVAVACWNPDAKKAGDPVRFIGYVASADVRAKRRG
jgi:hypothetical protein